MENNKEIISIFYDDSSLRGILNWWPEKEYKEGGSMPIIKLAKEAGLKQIFFVSSNFHTYREAVKRCEEANIQLCFGLSLWVTDDSTEKTEQSTLNESKVIIWSRNSQGEVDLSKLFSEIQTKVENKYYHYRGDWKTLKKMWTPNLNLSLPFFDSFVHRNLLNYGTQIIPDLPSNPIIMREINSGLPFARLIDKALDEYNKNQEFEEINTKTIYYEKYEDSSAWQVYRGIGIRSNFQKPQMEYCSSRNFCFEDYLNLIKL